MSCMGVPARTGEPARRRRALDALGRWLRIVLWFLVVEAVMWFFLGSPTPLSLQGLATVMAVWGLIELVRGCWMARDGETRNALLEGAVSIVLLVGAVWLADGWRPLAAGVTV